MSRLLLGKQLTGLGHRVWGAEGGFEALEQVAARRFDAIITDCDMPGMDGFQLSKAVRNNERRLGVSPIIILGHTASSDLSEHRRCHDSGMNGFLIKPATMEQLSLSLIRKSSDETAEPDGKMQNSSAERLYDSSRLDMLAEGDSAARRMLLREFIICIDEDISGLQSHIANDCRHEVSRSIHRMKGAALMIGAKALVIAAKSYESALFTEAPEREIKQLSNHILCLAIQVKAEVSQELVQR